MSNPIEAISASPSVSSKYQFVSTAQIRDHFVNRGFAVSKSGYSSTRKPEKQGFQSHFLRFRSNDLQGASGLKVGDLIPEIRLKTSHAGTEALLLDLGVFRLVCGNGMVVADQTLDTFRVRHVGTMIFQQIDENIDKIIIAAKTLTDKINRYKSINLNPLQQHELAKALIDMRLAGVQNIVKVDYIGALQPVRQEDTSNDLFTVYNRVQERLVRGGIKFVTSSPDNVTQLRNNSTRLVKSEGRDTDLNKAAWNIMSGYADKVAA